MLHAQDIKRSNLCLFLFFAVITQIAMSSQDGCIVQPSESPLELPPLSFHPSLPPTSSPFVFDDKISLQKLPDKVFNTNIMTRTYLISFKKNPQLVFEFESKDSAWKGLKESWVSPVVRGKTFNSMTDIQHELDPSLNAEFVASNFFVIDKSKRIITTTTMERSKTSRTAKQPPTTSAVPLPPVSQQSRSSDDPSRKKTVSMRSPRPSDDVDDPAFKPTRRKTNRSQPSITETPPASGKKKYKVISTISPSMNPQPPPPPDKNMVIDVAVRPFRLVEDGSEKNLAKTPNGGDSMVDSMTLIAPSDSSALRSVFPSTETIEQRYKPDPVLVAKVNGYDQHNETFLCRCWMTETEIANRNMKWNPVGAYYALFYYISKILKWPLEEVRVVVNYDTNAVKFNQVISQVYKLYKIEDKLAESTIITKLVVWCIVSMNSFGIIRPMIFKGTSEKSHRVEELCASKQTYERILYYVTWPFRMDAGKVYVLRNRTKLHEIPMKTTFLSDLHAERDKDKEKLLKGIPEWVYTLIKRP